MPNESTKCCNKHPESNELKKIPKNKKTVFVAHQTK